jgi:hypothetical protein
MSTNGKWRKAPVKAINGFSNWLIGTIGVNVQGAKVLTVRGRSSGALRSVTVNPLELDGHTYLLSPRGQTQWVKNLRHAETGTLKRGKEIRAFRVVQELPDTAKPPVISAYVERCYWQIGKQMNVPKQPGASTPAAIAPNHPVVEIAFDS